MSKHIIEGAARYVVGERLDCSGMRWIPARAQMILQLRCIEVNNDWERFYAWVNQTNIEKMKKREKIMIRLEKAPPLIKFAEKPKEKPSKIKKVA